MQGRVSLAIVVVVSLALLVPVVGFAQDAAPQKPTTQIGLGFIAYASTHFDDEGVFKSVSGINWALGYSKRNYFSGLTAGQFNPYWGWGSIVLLIPYVELGTTYAIGLNDDKTNLLNFNMGIIYVIPYVTMSVMF